MKIRAQIMLQEETWITLRKIQHDRQIKNISQLIDKILKEAFQYRSLLDEKEKVIMNLQNVITELGEKANNYRKQIIEMDRGMKNE